jgi:citrate synthase
VTYPTLDTIAMENRSTLWSALTKWLERHGAAFHRWSRTVQVKKRSSRDEVANLFRESEMRRSARQKKTFKK